MPTLKNPRPIKEIEATTNRLIGRRLRKLRKARGLSLKRLGCEIGVNYQTIQKYEKGARITPGKLKLLAQTLGVSVRYFFDGGRSERHREPPECEALEFMRVLQRMEHHQPVRFLAMFKMVKTMAKAGSDGPAHGGGS